MRILLASFVALCSLNLIVAKPWSFDDDDNLSLLSDEYIVDVSQENQEFMASLFFDNTYGSISEATLVPEHDDNDSKDSKEKDYVSNDDQKNNIDINDEFGQKDSDGLMQLLRSLSVDQNFITFTSEAILVPEKDDKEYTANTENKLIINEDDSEEKVSDDKYYGEDSEEKDDQIKNMDANDEFEQKESDDLTQLQRSLSMDKNSIESNIGYRYWLLSLFNDSKIVPEDGELNASDINSYSTSEKYFGSEPPSEEVVDTTISSAQDYFSTAKTDDDDDDNDDDQDSDDSDTNDDDDKNKGIYWPDNDVKKTDKDLPFWYKFVIINDVSEKPLQYPENNKVSNNVSPQYYYDLVYEPNNNEYKNTNENPKDAYEMINVKGVEPQQQAWDFQPLVSDCLVQILDENNEKHQTIVKPKEPKNILSKQLNDNVVDYIKIHANLATLTNNLLQKEEVLTGDFLLASNDDQGMDMRRFEDDLNAISSTLDELKRTTVGLQNMQAKLYINHLFKNVIQETLLQK